MHWKIKLDKDLISEGLMWCKEFARQYDLSKLKYIFISPGFKRYLGLYGICRNPECNNVPYYRISCHLPGPFPFSVKSEAKGHIYKDRKKGWPPLPEGTKVEARGKRKVGTKFVSWRRIPAYTEVQNYNEALVWIFGHEMFHFLRWTNQIPGINVESQADAFGDKLLELFRNKQSV